MNRLVIPSILTAAVLIAGMFAFMPIEKASTVHQTLLANTADLQVLTLTGGAATNGNEIEIACGATAAADKNRPFTVLAFSIRSIQNNAADDFEVDDIEVNDVALTNADSAVLPDININTGAITSNPLLIPLSVQNIGASGELDFIMGIANGGAVDTFDARATILTEGNSVCALTTGPVN